MTNLSDVARMAVNLARNCGYSPFPCNANKTPACPNGFYDSSKDPDQIIRLWKRHPAPLIGIRTGAASGIDVLDVDPKHQPARLWWQRRASRLPVTRAYRTQSGGAHLYFRNAEGVRNSEGRICKGVDVRGEGGYCIFWFAAGLPCIGGEPPADWPEWLLDEARPPPKPPAPRLPGYEAGTGHDSGVEAIRRLVSGAAEGQRNSVLFWGSCRFAERVRVRGMSASVAESLLIDAARACGLSDIEGRRTIRSALRSVLHDGG